MTSLTWPWYGYNLVFCVMNHIVFVAELRDAFYDFDKNDNGSICKEELASVLKEIGQFSPELELDKGLQEGDINRFNQKLRLNKGFGARTRHQGHS